MGPLVPQCRQGAGDRASLAGLRPRAFAGAGGPLGQQALGLGDLDLDVGVGRQLDRGFVGPGSVTVRPSLDDQFVPADLARFDKAGPHVVAQVCQGADGHDAVAFVQDSPGSQCVVAVPEDACGHRDVLPYHGFGRVTMRGGRPHVLDDHVG